MEVIMKRSLWILPALVILSCTSCDRSKKDSAAVVSQQFIHKYGFNLSEAEWNNRAKNGKMITVLQTGVTVSNNYVNGLLQGETTYTFPKSTIISTVEHYRDGVLTKRQVNDEQGLPLKEEMIEIDGQKTITFWYEDGCPMSVEEYKNDILQYGAYYNTNHDLEAKVDNQGGERVIRERKGGALLFKDKIEKGKLVFRTTYHPNGVIASQSSYDDYKLNGDQLKFNESGQPIFKASWDHEILNGMKTTYQNGNKTWEVFYVNGKKHGIEKTYDEKGKVTSEVKWDNGQKHGSARYFGADNTKIAWYFHGKAVSAQDFVDLDHQEKFLASFPPIKLSK
jgi:antitoxin component YwqK of YwqJK toxin-antitoxin module